jgi:hypothetical protein
MGGFYNPRKAKRVVKMANTVIQARREAYFRDPEAYIKSYNEKVSGYEG